MAFSTLKPELKIDKDTVIIPSQFMSMGEYLLAVFFRAMLIQGKITDLYYNKPLPEKLRYSKHYSRYYKQVNVDIERDHKVYVDFTWTDVDSGKTCMHEYNGYGHIGIDGKHVLTLDDQVNYSNRDTALLQYCLTNGIPLSVTQVPNPGLKASNDFNAKLSQQILEDNINASIQNHFNIYKG